MSRLIDVINEMKNEKGLFKINPKDKDDKKIGPLNMVYYARPTNLTIETTPVNIMRKKTVELDNEMFESENISKQEAEKLCRCKFEAVGFKYATKYIDKQGIIILEVSTNYGIIKPVVFPHEDSNVGIFCNNSNETSYVADGRIKVVNNKIYNLSINQEAIKSFIAEREKTNISLQNAFSKEYWQLTENEDEDIIKALNILGPTKYLNFPRMEDGTPYNQIWSNERRKDSNGKEYIVPLYTLAVENELENYMRYSSLSQNGMVAQAGPLGKLTSAGYEIQPVKQFKGTKGKLDISATQGPKTYKQSSYKGRCLVVLAEISNKNEEYSANTLGNILVTTEAYNSYASDLTKDYSKEHKIEYPAHKVFVKVNGEVVRIKGAASFKNMVATLQDGTMEDKIVVLPPREYSPKGTLEEDFEKFEYLCKWRDSESKLQMIELEVNGTTLKVPALYCDIYEDAAHSAVYSLKVKAQNIFYYGALMSMYQFNGKEKMFEAISSMLDHNRIAHAMNFCGLTKMYIKDQHYEDWLKTL